MSQIVKQLMDEILNTIAKYDHAYYVESKPLVPDSVYDNEFRKLQALEKEYPELIIPDSPTQRVSGSVKNGFKNINHKTPMLSIKTETEPSMESLNNWHESLAKSLSLTKEEVPLVIERKYDGLALSLSYVNGILSSAATRGDGTTGEDVFNNALHIKGIPGKLFKGSDTVEIRGEVLITKEDFKKLNASQVVKGEKEFINARNAAAGTLRSHDSKVVASRNLTFIPYGVFGGSFEGIVCSLQTDYLDILKEYGFQTVDYFLLPKGSRSTENNFGFMKHIEQSRRELPYEIDGVVYKVNNLEQQRLLGSRNREPVWAIAYKFPPEQTTTVLEAIDVQVGRTGKLTPVARLKPVFVGGTTISNVTLHNVFDLRNRKVRINDVVVVQRAGDVIPEIVEPLKEYRKSYLTNFHMPKKCPVCAGDTMRIKGEREYRCTNTLNCKSQAEQAILHYVSKLGMNINGLGVETVKSLMKIGLLSNILDIYNLNAGLLFRKSNLGEKTIVQLIHSIEKSKDTTFQKFIYALGIPNVGEGTSKRLTKHYKTIDELCKATEEDLKRIDDIGPIVSKSVVTFFNTPASYEISTKIWLKHLRIELTKTDSEKLKDLSFVFTGTFDGVSRDELKAMVEINGGTNQNGVSKKTTYLVAGEGGGVKATNAKALGVKILSQEEFLDLIK